MPYNPREGYTQQSGRDLKAFAKRSRDCASARRRLAASLRVAPSRVSEHPIGGTADGVHTEFSAGTVCKWSKPLTPSGLTNRRRGSSVGAFGRLISGQANQTATPFIDWLQQSADAILARYKGFRSRVGTLP